MHYENKMKKSLTFFTFLLSGCANSSQLETLSHTEAFRIEDRGPEYSFAMFRKDSDQYCIDGFGHSTIAEAIRVLLKENKQILSLKIKSVTNLKKDNASILPVDDGLLSSSRWIKINNDQLFLSCDGTEIFEILSIVANK